MRDISKSDPSLWFSLPLTLRVPPEGVGELGIALAAADGALHQIDPLSQIGQPAARAAAYTEAAREATTSPRCKAMARP